MSSSGSSTARTGLCSSLIMLLALIATAIASPAAPHHAPASESQHHSQKPPHPQQQRQQHHQSQQQETTGLSATFQEGFPDWRVRQLLGQVSGVTVDQAGRSYLFHRANRPWQMEDFDEHNKYTEVERGPIQVSTIVELDADGKLLGSYGEDIFYLPHGITVDKDGNLWTTDVALHQVIRLNKKSRKPDLVVGEKFVPGSDSSHFCKPTKVAVASNGHFFVADGYCNSRVMKFDAAGKYIGEFGKKPTGGSPVADAEFLVPHGLALLESLDLLCVADRENRRVECFKAGLRDPAEFGKFVRRVGSADTLGRVFDVAFAPSGELMVLHNEDSGISMVSAYRTETDLLVTRFTFVPDSSDDSVGFGDGHSVAVSPRGDYVLVSSLTPMCDSDKDDCFGDRPTEVPYQVFKFNVDTNATNM